jgi:hypothetical protein
MRRARTASFTVYTARGRGSYRSRVKADSAARWVARETGESVSVMDEGTGEIWVVPARCDEARNGRAFSRSDKLGVPPEVEPPKTGRTREELATLPSPVP